MMMMDDKYEEDEFEDEYPLEIIDPFWKREYESLRRKGVRDNIAKRVIIQSEREVSMKVAYR